MDYKLRVLLRSDGCIDCDGRNAAVLDFDHVADKEAAIGQLVFLGASRERLEAEMARCVVRCANCQRRKTAREVGMCGPSP